jgi:ER lumen protein retaining receptor
MLMGYVWLWCNRCAVLALIINEEFSLVEILWTFSIYLEAVAIIPQLMVVHAFARAQSGFVEGLTSHYVFALVSSSSSCHQSP